MMPVRIVGREAYPLSPPDGELQMQTWYVATLSRYVVELQRWHGEETPLPS